MADNEKVRKLFEEYYIPDKRHEEVAEEGMETFYLNHNGIIEFDEFEKVIDFLVSEKGYFLK